MREDRERLAPVLAQIEAGGGSPFLDLCELLLMVAETMPHARIKWQKPRVTVHIKQQRSEGAVPSKPSKKKKVRP